MARVVARRPVSRPASRMGCVVDSTARPARDGSDGCCYLTPGAKVSPWTTATSQVYALSRVRLNLARKRNYLQSVSNETKQREVRAKVLYFPRVHRTTRALMTH